MSRSPKSKSHQGLRPSSPLEREGSYSPGISRKNIRRQTLADFRSFETAKPTNEGFLMVKIPAAAEEETKAKAKEGQREDAPSTDFAKKWCVLMEYHLLVFEDNDSKEAAVRIVLKDISQVEKKPESLIFELKSEKATICWLKAVDATETSWWLYGLQKAIFQQSQHKIEELKRQEQQSPVRLLRSATVSGALSPVRNVNTIMKMAAKWMNITLTSNIGRRRSMEDQHCIIEDMNTTFNLPVTEYQHLTFVGVYDGHAGQEAAEYCKEFLCSNVVETPDFARGDIVAALKAGFVQTDEEFRGWALDAGNISGSTAIAVIIQGTKLYVASAGDCRCVVSRGGTAVGLSVDHKPEREDEKARIEAAGGWIESLEVLNIPKLYRLGMEHKPVDDSTHELVGWVTVHKVMGALGMTRSLGDILIKDMLAENFESAHEDGQFTAPLVLSEPTVMEDVVADEDEFMIVACDGLWDVFSNQECVDYVRTWLRNDREKFLLRSKEQRRNLMAERLIQRAIELGSLDNVSVAVVFFDHEARKHRQRLGSVGESRAVGWSDWATTRDLLAAVRSGTDTDSWCLFGWQNATRLHVVANGLGGQAEMARFVPGSTFAYGVTGNMFVRYEGVDTPQVARSYYHPFLDSIREALMVKGGQEKVIQL